MTLLSSIQYMVYGIIAVAILDVIGAIASRKLNFQYSLLIPFSLAIYTVTAYFTSKEFGLNSALITNAVIGLFDGTVGFKLSMAFKANTRISDEDIQKLSHTPATAILSMIIAIIFAFLGHFLATT